MGAAGKKVNVLISCIGRRVSLLRDFRKAARVLGLDAKFIGIDSTAMSAAIQLCDVKEIVKPVTRPGYLKELLGIVKKHKVGLIVPTIDTELLLLAKNRSRFAKLGCLVLISPPEVIELCQDKRKTYRFLRVGGFDTPETMSFRGATARKSLKYPCFLKPWDGFASRGNVIVRNRAELLFFGKRVPNCIVQPFISGVEYTCDAYVDFDMNVRCVVPRKRIETRGGEVSKGQVCKNSMIMGQVAEVVSELGVGPGVITIQVILTADNKVKFIEINPRFGGGAPLSVKAGANFPKWLLQELTGIRPNIRFAGFRDNLVMLRYDGEVWLEG